MGQIVNKNVVLINVDRRWKEQARKDALEGNPPRDAVLPDPRQEEIRRFFDGLFAQNRKPMLDEADAIAERLNKTRSALVETKQKIAAREPVAQVEQTLHADLESAKPETIRRLKHKLNAYSHLRIFQDDHGLTRTAERRKKPIEAAAQISITLVAETFMNAWFYSTGVGLVAGAVVAFIFSLVVALLGFVTGYAGRYINAKPALQRVGGWLALVGGTVVAVYLSSVTATYRSLVEFSRIELLQNPDASTDLYAQSARLFATALDDGRQIFLFHIPFHELNSTLLFALALIAFLNATIAGYRFEDPVPGYSKASEQHDAAEAARQAAETNLRRALRAAADRMKSERKRLVDEVNGASRAHGDVSIKFERCTHKLAELAEKLNNEYKHSVSEFRAENTRIRAIPPPAYYSEAIDDAGLETNPLVFENIRTSLDALAYSHAELEPEIATLNAEIAELSDLRAQLETSITDVMKEWSGEAIRAYEDEHQKYSGPRTITYDGTAPASGAVTEVTRTSRT
jgi:uncharacterized protein YukE